MKPLLTILLLPLGVLAQDFLNPPGLPVGSPRSKGTAAVKMAAAVSLPATSNLFSIKVISYTPQISNVEFYCSTNRPAKYRLERSDDLVSWRTVEQKLTTNAVQHVPKLDNDKRLVTWQLVKPGKAAEFYRIEALP